MPAMRTPEEKKKHLTDMMFGKHLYMTMRIIALTIAPLAIFGGVGYWVDGMMGTAPLFLIIGIVVAFVVTQTLIITVFHKLSK